VEEAAVRRHSVGGFTLIEVLVALFLLAVGIVGAAATQTLALRTRHQSSLLSGGVQLAATLADRMRANAAQMALSDAANPYLQFDYDARIDGAPPAPAALCFGAAQCDAAQMAAFDLHETALALHAAFPNGRMLVCRDAGGWDAAAGALSWDCAPGAGAPIVVKLGWHAPGQQRNAGPRIAMVVP
jgi:type IV pilus assembly protein PilV